MKPNIQIESVGNEYALYVNDNYMGVYNKATLNIKLRGWNLPEIEI